MKDVCCKVLAAIFIFLIIVSLIEMRRDFNFVSYPSRAQHTSLSTPDIHLFDWVLLSDNRLGIVEDLTNNKYHVVFKDTLGHTVHGVYEKTNLQKVIVVTPHTHE